MDSETALTTPTTAFVTDWTRLAWRLSPAIQSIKRPARLTVITFRFMSDYDDLHFAELPAFNEGISQIGLQKTTVPRELRSATPCKGQSAFHWARDPTRRDRQEPILLGRTYTGCLLYTSPSPRDRTRS